MGLVVFVSVIDWHCFGGFKPIEEEELELDNWNAHCVGKQHLIDIYNNVWFPWIDAIIFWVVPSVVMLFVNTVIIKTIRSQIPQNNEAKEVPRPGTNPRTGDVSSQTNVAFQKHGGRLTNIALVLSFSMFILLAPAMVFTLILLITEAKGETLPLTEHDTYLVENVVYVIYVINYSCNFWLYCFSTPSFRMDLKEMMCGKTCCYRCEPKENERRADAAVEEG